MKFPTEMNGFPREYLLILSFVLGLTGEKDVT